MKKNLLIKSMLLLCALIVGSGTMWAEETTIASFTASEYNVGTTNNWTVSNADYVNTGKGYYKLISSDDSIATPSIEWTKYSGITITISARKFGGPNATQGKISVLQKENELNSYSPAGTSIVASSALSISPDDGTITISCPGASDSKGCGIQSIVIKGTLKTGGDTPTTYTVTYNGNGATSGDVPTDATEYDNNSTVTVLSCGNLTKEHYSFTGWNTVAGGTGTGYVAGNTFNISANTTLYAQWAVNTNTVTLPETNEYGTYTMSAENPVAYGTEVTLTYTPAEGYENYKAIWSVNGETITTNKFTMPDEAVNVTVKMAKIMEMAIDFENDATTYSDWTFTNIVSNHTVNGVNSHGGSKYGSTNAEETGYIQTKETVTPASLTCYVSKQTSNSTSSTWYVQVSTDGNTWTNVKNISASSMSKGEWIELATDLSSYSDVYVRIYYSGTTAIRLIDDLTLVLRDSNEPLITADDVSIAADQTSGEISYTISDEPDPIGTLSASVPQDSWVFLSGVYASPIGFTCDENPSTIARTATVTLTYTYGEQSVTKDVIITQEGNPNVADNISDIKEVDTSYSVRGTVVATNSKGLILGDGTGYAYYYKNSAVTQSVGDMIKISGTTGLYGHVIQFTNSATVTEETTSTYNNTPAATVITTVPDYTEGNHLSNYLEFEGTLSKNGNNYFIALGESQIQISYPTTAQGTALTDLNGKNVRVKGYFTGINTNSKFTVMLEEVVSTEPILNVNPSTVTLAADATSGEFGYTIDNPIVGQSLSATSEAAWISNITVETENVTFTTEANTGAERTATITLTYGNQTKKVTVKQAEIPDVEVEPAVAGVGCFVKVTSTDDITAGNYLIIYEGNVTKDAVAFNGGLDNLDVVNNGVSVTIVDGKILATETTVDATFVLQPNKGSLKSASGLYIGRATNSNGLETAESTLANSIEIDDNGNAIITAEGKCTLRYNSNSDQMRFRYYKSGQQVIKLYKYDASATVNATVNITPAGLATYCSTGALDFSNVEGLTAYKATLSGTELSFDEVTTVPAGTGVLLKGNSGTYQVPVIASAEAIENNVLVGVTEATQKEAGIFVLMNGDRGVGFYKTTNTFTVGANTAYIDDSSLPANVRFIGFDGETTGITTMTEMKTNGSIYNLNGQRVTTPKKGLYIMNGKKVVNK